jgi:type VI secretion system protein ImpE
MPTRAEELFRSGDLDGCAKELQNEVRQKPADAKLRVFLSQLLMVTGQWDRAVTQLSVVAEMDSQALPMAHAYRSAIQCELLRREVFAGKRSPLVFGDPEPWIAPLLQALTLDGEGHHAKAAELRAQALEAAPATGGKLNGKSFEWLADADSRFGPMFEVLLNGSYYWVPVSRIRSVKFEAPSDVRDFVWISATFTWSNEGEAMGLVPVRYPGTESVEDAGLRLSRATGWKEVAPGNFHGQGQRILTSDSDELGLLQVREIEFASN